MASITFSFREKRPYYLIEKTKNQKIYDQIAQLKNIDLFILSETLIIRSSLFYIAVLVRSAFRTQSFSDNGLLRDQLATDERRARGRVRDDDGELCVRNDAGPLSVRAKRRLCDPKGGARGEDRVAVVGAAARRKVSGFGCYAKRSYSSFTDLAKENNKMLHSVLSTAEARAARRRRFAIPFMRGRACD